MTRFCLPVALLLVLLSSDGVPSPVSDLPVSSLSVDADVEALRDRLEKGSSPKQQLQAVQALAATPGSLGEAILIDRLRHQLGQPATIIEGAIVQVLTNSESSTATDFLATHYPNGLIILESELDIDYTPIQQCLAQKDYEQADRLTLQKMCELAGPVAVRRKWLYFSDVDQFPATDLKLLDQLWIVYSEGRFGFSVQRELWLKSRQDWEQLWPKIGWKKGNIWTRYPHEFTWDLTAPRGHLPLSNQLRGVRVMASLMQHPVWTRPNP